MVVLCCSVYTCLSSQFSHPQRLHLQIHGDLSCSITSPWGPWCIMGCDICSPVGHKVTVSGEGNCQIFSKVNWKFMAFDGFWWLWAMAMWLSIHPWRPFRGGSGSISEFWHGRNLEEPEEKTRKTQRIPVKYHHVISSPFVSSDMCDGGHRMDISLEQCYSFDDAVFFSVHIANVWQ